MARGSLAGIVSGVVVSGLALGVASLSLPPVEMGGSMPADGAEPPAVMEAEPAPDAAPEPASGDSAATGDAGADDGPAAEDMAPESAPEPEPDAEPEATPPAETDAMPETDPEPQAATGTETETETGADTEAAPEAEAGGDAPEPAPQADPTEAPDAPEAPAEAEPLTGEETGADPASAPAADEPPTPQRGEAAEVEITAQPEGAALPETDRAPQMEIEPVKEPTALVEEPDAIPGTELVEKLPPALPPANGADEAPEANAAPDAAPASGPDSGPDTSGDKSTGNALSVEPDGAPEIATIVAEPAPAPSTVVTVPEPAAEPAPETATTPEPGLSGADNVVVGRLPTIGGDAPVTDDAGETETGTVTGDAVALPSSDQPALERNRVAFEAPGDLPLLALLLIDSGDRVALEDIGKLPFPLTVAVDASAPDAAEAIAFYDTRGIEVALVLPLPDGATPADVDTTVQAYRPLLDEAAEVVVEAALGFQALGPGAVQLATNLAESGHGLVSFPSGLNTGHKAAVKQGVPSGLVFLDLDGEGQNGPVIRRFLDNAAFRARNENGVIVLARTRPETLQALLEWSLGNRAQSVALAPISSVLLAQ